MVQREKDNLLFDHTKHTNVSVPMSQYVGYQKFPAQDPSMLNKVVDIKFRNMYIPDREITGADQFEEHDIYTRKTRILRYDIDEPYVFIGCTLDYKFIFVSDTRYWRTKVVQYPIQFFEFTGINVLDQYYAQVNRLRGVTLRVDEGEPCHTVIAERYVDGTMRMVLGDECHSLLVDYYGISDDYNGRDSIDYREEYVDVDGADAFITMRPNITFKDIDGGLAEILVSEFNADRTEEEVISIRKEILEGATIYAATKDWTT